MTECSCGNLIGKIVLLLLFLFKMTIKSITFKASKCTWINITDKADNLEIQGNELHFIVSY